MKRNDHLVSNMCILCTWMWDYDRLCQYLTRLLNKCMLWMYLSLSLCIAYKQVLAVKIYYISCK